MQFHIFKAEIILLHSIFFLIFVKKKPKIFKEARSDKTVTFKRWMVVFSGLLTKVAWNTELSQTNHFVYRKSAMQSVKI